LSASFALGVAEFFQRASQITALQPGLALFAGRDCRGRCLLLTTLFRNCHTADYTKGVKRLLRQTLSATFPRPFPLGTALPGKNLAIPTDPLTPAYLSRLTYAASDVGRDPDDDAALRTAKATITRLTPLKMRLMPTKVPMAQAELDGHCA
jgi:hypothetical protein